jgi:hypothetical protein
VGGFFEATEISDQITVPWPAHNVFFALARHVVPGILRVIESTRRLWIPDYFCPDVSRHWSRLIRTITYRDDPSLPEPDWKSLQPDEHDLVIAVNYFGTRNREPWEHWRSLHRCILLEDHTHDPVSSWALTSNAEYVFSSLRKSIPVTDGAICWSPLGLPLPQPVSSCEADGIALKFTAMAEKADALSGKASPELKSRYRELYAEGDKRLEEGSEAPISDLALRFASPGIAIGWRLTRARNVRGLLDSIEEMNRVFEPLFRQWPTDAVPFAVVLVFSNRKDRDDCRSYLEANKVFCPIHWAVDAAESSAVDLSARILSIPADQRYDDDDIARIATILSRWKPGLQL